MDGWMDVWMYVWMYVTQIGQTRAIGAAMRTLGDIISPKQPDRYVCRYVCMYVGT